MATVRRQKGDGIKRFRMALKELDGVQGKVGYLDRSTYADGTPIAYVAAIQETGYAPGGIPPRPTLGPAIDKNADKYKRILENGAKQVLAGGASAMDVMELVAEVAAGDVKAEISALTSPPNAPSTIRQKRHSKPLIGGGPVGSGHTGGQMLAAVTGQAERGTTK